MQDFVHLHVHSEYSLLDGACRIDDLLDHVQKLNMKSIAITDHGVMYGVVDFYKKAKDRGIKPIIGCEVYVAPRTIYDKNFELDGSAYHLVLLCKNEVGYKNLTYMVSKGFTEGFYVKPRIDMNLLREHNEGLICLSACLGGIIPSKLSNNDFDGAVLSAKEFIDIFGHGDFYIELQDQSLPEQASVNRDLIKIANMLDIDIVATNDVHYVKKEDSFIQDVLMCIQMNKTVDDTNRMKFASEEFYLKSAEEMSTLFSKYPEAVSSSLKIADKCSFDFEFGAYHLPEFAIPNGLTSKQYLEKLCLSGYYQRYQNEQHLSRLYFELNMINQMGFTDYFLIVNDFIAFARKNNIPVGPGRGSAAGSIVSYCLFITNLDPIKYSLYFERFLNPERISMPDIDIDFCYERRSEVIDYVINKYGQDKVAQIVTFGTMAARGAVRDVGRALNISYSDVDKIAKLIPNELHMTIDKALSSINSLKEIYNNDDKIHKLIDTSRALEGIARHSSTHAAGVVITNQPVHEYVPLSKNDESIVTQFPMTTLEDLGLLKMDFLGLRTLTVINDAQNMIKKDNPDFDIEKIPLDDLLTYEMLEKGQTAGVFQLESTGITNVISSLRPRSIEDITSVISLYRPGPMQSIPKYIECKNNPEKVVYDHPLLENILGVTYGCMVYQEQVMEVFRILCGYSLGKADMVRRAMSKKKMKELEKERINFVHGNQELGIDGAIKRGVPEKIANEIFDKILDFANYAFNKSHAVCYALVAYQTAYLKCHYKEHFMAALLTSVIDFSDKTAKYIGICKEMDIGVLPPDINTSLDTFTICGHNILFCMTAIKNIGKPLIKRVIYERETNGKFISFYDFLKRMGNDINKRALEYLIKGGCFDKMGYKRSVLLKNFESAFNSLSHDKRNNLDGQIDLFSINASTSYDNDKEYFEDMDELTNKTLLIFEKEATSMYLSGHPLSEYSDIIKDLDCAKISDIVEDLSSDNPGCKYKDNMTISICVVINKIKLQSTRNGSVMAYVTVEDIDSQIDVIFFAKVLNEFTYLLKEDATVIIVGRISAREDESPKIICQSISPLNKINTKDALYDINIEKNQTLYLRLPDINYDKLPLIKEVLQEYAGEIPVILYDSSTKKKYRGSRDLYVSNNFEVLEKLRFILGHDNVIIKEL